ncbi:ADP-ribosylglycohydrolase family protein [Planctomycetota bacterium]
MERNMQGKDNLLEPSDYAERVYAGVLGKVIGVYLGQPIEGWSNERIERELGEIRWYVHDRFNRPLVAADDDIAGTLTFVRAIDDHSTGRDITSEQIGQTWLNYLVEGEHILWWGGVGVSTEHTAWFRLKNGVRPPDSGSIETNGPMIAQDIGGQIFIDGWAMVAPGNPDLAADLAARAARVSHDGAAVHAGMAVAAMESLAFVEPDMFRLFDCARSYLPDDSIIAAVHRDVRTWADANGDDWRKTLATITNAYGDGTFPGVVPNHAVMVMAWAHAPASFSRSMTICATAGFDTDCNMGNVGCLMGIRGGLAGIPDAGRDWQKPFADRVIIPTAEGSRSITDVLREAENIVRMGRQVMEWPAKPAAKSGARFHFSLPGALHGFMSEGRRRAEVENAEHARFGRCMKISLDDCGKDGPSLVLTPAMLTHDRVGRVPGTVPTLYSGQELSVSVAADAGNTASVHVALCVQYYASMGEEPVVKDCVGEKAELAPGSRDVIVWRVPDTGGCPIFRVGLSIESPGDSVLYVDRMDWTGSPLVTFPAALFPPGYSYPHGWTLSGKPNRCVRPSDSLTNLLSARELTILSTGTSDWRDYSVSADVSVRLADSAGIMARYAGLRRHLALEFGWRRKEIRLVRQFDSSRRTLASATCDWHLNEFHTMRLDVRGQDVTAFGDEQKLFSVRARRLPGGGIALFSHAGSVRFRNVRVGPVVSM